MAAPTNCSECGGDLEYLQYTVRVGGSHPLHVFKCEVCGRKQYDIEGPSKKNGGVHVHNN